MALNERNIKDMLQQLNLDKYIAILIFVLCIACNIVLLTVPPIVKYEISIYTALPAYYWITLVTSTMLSIILLIRSDNKTYFYLAFLGILINYTILIFLSYIRGYFLPVDGTWDVYYHIAQANFIESKGTIRGFTYPAIHIILMMIKTVGITKESMAVSSVLASFHILFLIFSLYVVKVVFNGQETQKFCFLFFIPFLLGKYHIVLMPFQCALVLLLLFIGVLFKVITANVETSTRYSVPLIIIGTALVFFHPLVFIMVICVLVVGILGAQICPFILKEKFVQSKLHVKKLLMCMFILLSIIYLNWLIISGLLSLPVKSIYEFTLDDAERSLSLLGHGKSVLADENMELTYKISRFTIMYGTLAIYFLIGSLGLLTILHRIYKKFSTELDIDILLLGITAIVLGLLQLTGSFVILEIERALAFFIILTPILCGIFFSNLLLTHKRHFRTIINIIFILVVFATIIGIFDLYYSPSNTLGHPSPMVSYTDKSGIEFTIVHMDKNIPIIQNVNHLRLWPDYIYGPNEQYRLNIKSTTYLPSHLGYTEHYYFSENYEGDYYLLINERLKQSSLGGSYSVYLGEDFKRLDEDRSVEKLYSSNEFELWFVSPYR